jgi:drug/metabolite transporter (DMT)-like permease
MPLRLILVLLALALGLNWPAVKIMLGVIPLFALRWLSPGGGAQVLALFAARRGLAPWPVRCAWPGIWMSAVNTVMLFNFSTALAQLATSTSRAAVLTFTTPLMAAALDGAFLGEHPGRRGGTAVVPGSVGVAVLARRY